VEVDVVRNFFGTRRALYVPRHFSDIWNLVVPFASYIIFLSSSADTRDILVSNHV
jgi:hypothetical protein